MTTYQQQLGTMMQHPGMAPGQPMAPGMGPSPGGPMGQPPGQGMPPGMPPGMGGPPTNQAMMAGNMHPGGPGAPNAHAMSQIQPQAHMFAGNRQMQQFAAQHNPNMMMQPNNQAILRQQQAIMQAQHLQQQGIAPGGPGMHPQQFPMNNIRQMNLPQGLGQVQQQPQAQGQRPQMPGMGMQHPQAGTPGQPGHPGQTIQMRPPQSIAGGDPQSAGPQQGPTPTSQAQPPPGTPHPPQNQPNPNQPPPRPASAASLPPNQSGPPQSQQQQPQQQPRPQGPQGQQPNAGQVPGQQGGPQPNQQMGPGQGQPPQGQVLDPQQQQQRMMQLRQQQMPQAAMNPMLRQQGFQPVAQHTPGTIRLAVFADKLATNPPTMNNANLSAAHRLHYLKTLVNDSFSDNAIFHRQLWNAKEKQPMKAPGENVARRYEISASLLPRYFNVHYEHGLERFQIVLGGMNEKTLVAAPPVLTGQYLECQRTMIIEWYQRGVQVIHWGNLKAIVNGVTGKIDWLEFVPTQVEAFHSRTNINGLFSAINDPPPSLESPKMSKKSEKQQQQHQQKLAEYERQKNGRTISYGSLPSLGVREDLYILPAVKNFLETAEIISSMKELVDYSLRNPSVKPVEAREKFIEALEESNKMAVAQNAQMMQAAHSGMSTPGMNGPPNLNMPGHFTSPHGNFNMGGSPHIGASPSQPQMGHPMGANPSQQGTNSTAASATASPNIQNKRRRSAVKNEGLDDGPSEVNGGNQTKVKQSPKQKRQKGAA